MLNDLFTRLQSAVPDRFEQYDDRSVWDLEKNQSYLDCDFAFWSALAYEVGLPGTLPIPDGYSLIEGLALFVVEAFEEKATKIKITDISNEALVDFLEDAATGWTATSECTWGWSELRAEVLRRMDRSTEVQFLYKLSTLERYRCPTCYRLRTTVKRRRMHTAYVNEETNWCVECADCFERTQEYWDERWSEVNCF